MTILASLVPEMDLMRGINKMITVASTLSHLVATLEALTHKNRHIHFLSPTSWTKSEIKTTFQVVHRIIIMRHLQTMAGVVSVSHNTISKMVVLKWAVFENTQSLEYLVNIV